MVLTHFWPPRPQFGSLIIHQVPSSLQEEYLGTVLGVFGVKKSPEKRGVHSGPKDASSAYLFFIRVRVTELVYQIGFTTFFRPQGRDNILAAAASSSKQQASNKQQQASN